MNEYMASDLATFQRRDQYAREMNKFIGGIMIGVGSTTIAIALVARFAIDWHALCQVVH